MVYLVSMLLKTLTSFYAKEVSTTKKLMPSYGAIGIGTTQYVVSEFMFPLFNQTLGPKICLVSIYFLDVFSSSLHPLKQARLTPK